PCRRPVHHHDYLDRLLALRRTLCDAGKALPEFPRIGTLRDHDGNSRRQYASFGFRHRPPPPAAETPRPTVDRTDPVFHRLQLLAPHLHRTCVPLLLRCEEDESESQVALLALGHTPVRGAKLDRPRAFLRLGNSEIQAERDRFFPRIAHPAGLAPV